MLDTQDLVSKAAGYLALSCAVWSHIPQLIRVWCEGTGAGPTYFFLVLWIVGDLTQLAGLVLNHGLQTQYFQSSWYAIGDVWWTAMLLYYQGHFCCTARAHERKARIHRAGHGITVYPNHTNAQHSPMRERSQPTTSTFELGRHRRRRSPSHRSTNSLSSPDSHYLQFNLGHDREKQAHEEKAESPAIVRAPGFKGTVEFFCFRRYKTVLNTTMLCLVLPLIMFVVWWFTAYKRSDVETIRHAETIVYETGGVPLIGWALAWFGVGCYCAPRAQNIYIVWRRKATEGLDYWMIASLAGENVFALISITATSREKAHLIAEMPFIIGACLGIAFDGWYIWLYFKYKGRTFSDPGNWSSLPYMLQYAAHDSPSTIHQDAAHLSDHINAVHAFNHKYKGFVGTEDQHRAIFREGRQIQENRRKLSDHIKASGDDARIRAHKEFTSKRATVKAHTRLNRRLEQHSDGIIKAQGRDFHTEHEKFGDYRPDDSKLDFDASAYSAGGSDSDVKDPPSSTSRRSQRKSQRSSRE